LNFIDRNWGGKKLRGVIWYLLKKKKEGKSKQRGETANRVSGGEGMPRSRAVSSSGNNRCKRADVRGGKTTTGVSSKTLCRNRFSEGLSLFPWSLKKKEATSTSPWSEFIGVRKEQSENVDTTLSFKGGGGDLHLTYKKNKEIIERRSRVEGGFGEKPWYNKEGVGYG